MILYENGVVKTLGMVTWGSGQIPLFDDTSDANYVYGGMTIRDDNSHHMLFRQTNGGGTANNIGSFGWLVTNKKITTSMDGNTTITPSLEPIEYYSSMISNSFGIKFPEAEIDYGSNQYFYDLSPGNYEHREVFASFASRATYKTPTQYWDDSQGVWLPGQSMDSTDTSTYPTERKTIFTHIPDGSHASNVTYSSSNQFNISVSDIIFDVSNNTPALLLNSSSNRGVTGPEPLTSTSSYPSFGKTESSVYTELHSNCFAVTLSTHGYSDTYPV